MGKTGTLFNFRSNSVLTPSNSRYGLYNSRTFFLYSSYEIPGDKNTEGDFFRYS